MKRVKILTASLVLIALTKISASAQDKNVDQHNIDIRIPEVAILDLETAGKSSIVLEAAAPTEAGNPLDFSNAKNTDLWINYSSIVGSKSDPSRTVTVQITSGAIPKGIEVFVDASKDAGLGEGTMGVPVGAISLSTASQKVLTDVGSAYTGDGPKRGHNLTYTMKKVVGEYAALDFDQSQTVVVTYTLSDN